jgi:hypothetical protein
MTLSNTFSQWFQSCPPGSANMWILFSRHGKVMLFVVSPFSEVAVSRRVWNTIAFPLCFCVSVLSPVTLLGQVDQQRAQAYFKEAATLCEREGGRLWGVSLIGPMVIADPVTHTIATSQPAPSGPRPPTLGFANAAMKWGDVRWSTFVWQMMPAEDQHARGRLMLHELFHRIQPQLGFVVRDGNNDHLDTLDGRYWMQLEWRALAKSLRSSGAARIAALRDALVFRLARRAQFSGAAENENLLEINEGLAQYTGTVASVASRAEAVDDAVDQLAKAAQIQTFIRTFAYASGAAYGLLLDDFSPGWARKVKSSDDLGQLLMAAARVKPAESSTAAANRYDGPALRLAEEKRDVERKARIAGLQRRFVDGPVLVLPAGGNFSFTTAGLTAIPGAGTLYPNFRVTSKWGTLEAAEVLMSSDRATLTVPAPTSVEGNMLRGDGWTITLSAGWGTRSGPRKGDKRIVEESP